MFNNTSVSIKLAPLAYDVKVILGIDVFIIVVAFLFNIVGILLLLSPKLKNLTPQNIYIIHMSFLSIINIGNNARAVYWKYHRTRLTKNFIAIYYLAHMAYIINLCFLSLDRLMFVAFPFQYRIKKSKFLVLLSLFILWLVSIVFGLLIKFGGIANDWFYHYASYIYNGFVIVLAVCVYVFIGFKTHLSFLIHRNRFANKKTKKLFTMSFLIIFTFFLFVFLPHLIAENVKFKSRKTKNLLVLGLIGVNILNNLSDPVIYIYFQPTVSKKLALFFRKFKNTFSCWKFNFLSPIFSVFYKNRKRKETVTSCSSLEIRIETYQSSRS
ncbi:succinate receptor 1 [Hydra vulgaris]|uniref:succinate receptor 1 n=1 Tax=Hydra vulgaris TaxID=6087 RepID=UPI000641057A|nr:succinate receptor 1-like [Hydra vulgaris]